MKQEQTQREIRKEQNNIQQQHKKIRKGNKHGQQNTQINQERQKTRKTNKQGPT